MKSGDFFCHTYLNFTLKIYLYPFGFDEEDWDEEDS
jgi:hypothetical protein